MSHLIPKRGGTKMITKGNICNFSFYVAEYDPQTGEEYSEPITELSLEQAKKEFERKCANTPTNITTVLGVDFTTDRRDLEPSGKGGAELLRREHGYLSLSDAYKQSQILKGERLISGNAIHNLDNEANRLITVSNRATAECVAKINENLQHLNGSPEEAEQFIMALSEVYGIDRIKGAFANELLGGYGIAGDETIEYLSSNYNGKYDEGNSIFMNAEQIERLTGVVKKVESGLTETQSKLKRSGLVFGTNEVVRDKSVAVAREIVHHNELEDRGLAADDELTL